MTPATLTEPKQISTSDFNVEARADYLSQLRVQSDSAHELINHWVEIAGNSLVPPKSALDPAAIKSALPYVMIYEFRQSDDIRFRLFGTGLHGAFRADLTGHNYLDYVPAERRQRTSERLHHCIEQPCGLLTHLLGPVGKDVLGLYEAVGLPLADSDGKIRFTIHISSLIERGVEPNGADERLLNVRSSEFFDLGAGLPSVGALI